MFKQSITEVTILWGLIIIVNIIFIPLDLLFKKPILGGLLDTFMTAPNKIYFLFSYLLMFAILWLGSVIVWWLILKIMELFRNNRHLK